MSRGESERKFLPLSFAVLTVSNTRTLADDKSGDLLVSRIKNSGHNLKLRQIIPDSRKEIADRLTELAREDGVDVVITTGGTGLTGFDVSVEAHRDVYEKEIDAFLPVFAFLSTKKIGASAIQSRACAGIANGTYMFALPGSPGACADAWDGILCSQLDYRNKPCNLVEILPRLDEHMKRK